MWTNLTFRKFKAPNKRVWILVLFLGLVFLLPNFEHPNAVNGNITKTSNKVLGAYTTIGETVASTALPRENATPDKPAVYQNSSIVAPVIGAKSVLAYDPINNVQIFSVNPNQELQIASLTKLMTALVAETDPNFLKPIVLNDNDALDVEPSLHLKAGDVVMPEDLLKAMLVGSANDAALALANHFPNKSDFISKMNIVAQNLGMRHTHYSTPIGFDDPQNYSTANDLKILVDYATTHLPYNEIWQQSSYSFKSVSGNNYFIKSSNVLIRSHPNILSIKTGQTPLSGGSMIVKAFEQPGILFHKSLDPRNIIVIVLDSPDREKDTLNTIDYIFKAFAWVY